MVRLRLVRRAPKARVPYCDCGWRKLHLNPRSGPVDVCPRCHPKLRAHADALILRSGIPERCHKGLKTLERTEDNAELLDDCIAALKNPELLDKGSWFIHGGTGSGKTQTAGVLGIELIRRWLKPVKYIQFGDYLNRIRFNLGQEADLRRQLRDVLDIEPEYGKLSYQLQQVAEEKRQAYAIERTSPILIVDDLVRRYRDGYEADRLYDIIEYRDRMKLFTITTAHDKAMPGVPEIVSSRILQMSHSYYTGEENRRLRHA